MDGAEPRPGAGHAGALSAWWRGHVADAVDHVAVVAQVREESTWSAHYVFMTLMSAGIAILGLLLSSPAVVIGAMLISPLMGPIMGLGFALATFDSARLRRSAAALLLGVLLAVGASALIVLASPLQTVTAEIAARTKPNLFDFLVALFSGLAGSYAMIRGRHGTIVGVAIATAIMPPLAVVGFGIATRNGTVLAGSALLFFTNLMTIAVTAALLARLYGFASGLSPRQTGVQATIVIVVLTALAVPLGLSLNRIAWETLASRQAQEAIAAEFGDDARVSQVALEHDTRPLEVRATVFTPHYKADADRALSARLTGVLGRPVVAAIEQFRVGNGPRQAEATQVAAARAPVVEGKDTGLAERLALVAGVPADRVLLDRTARRAAVAAAPLPGADLATYRALEARLAQAEPEWSIALTPPLSALPRLPAGADAAARGDAVATAAWAAVRLKLPVAVSGGSETEASALVASLRSAGADARRIPGRGPLSVAWLLPGSAAAAPSPSSPAQGPHRQR